jgi:tRNA-2-methylthio-N6-dimethylallyladenosine synthase
LIKKYYTNEKNNLFISTEKEDFAERLHPNLLEKSKDSFWHSFVTITHGCDNFCTYCIVPYVRGTLLSFSSTAILDQVKRLADNGTIEITLLGQNVNQYGQDTDDISFSELLDQCANINGIEKVNFLTSHPKDLGGDVIEVMATNTKVSKSLHLPLQSGSDTVLQKMNRHYTISAYLEIVDRLRIHGQFSLTTDIIVGFPGESRSDFEQTLSIIKKIEFDDAYMYAYSPREGHKICEL